MRHKTYPPDWNNRRYVPHIYKALNDSVNELNTHWSEEGLFGLYLHFRGTNTLRNTHINDNDLGVWLIALANKLNRPIHPIVIGVKNPYKATDHFHAILGLPVFQSEHPFGYQQMIKAMNTSWRQGTSRVMWADFDQEPFSPLEYIPGKHNWIQMKREVYEPRYWLRNQ
jgi:hypothetical protein